MSWKHIIAIAAVAVLSMTTWAGGWPAQGDWQSDGRGLSSSFRYDNLIRDENRVGRLVTSDFGGQFDNLLFAGDRWNWRYAYREFTLWERSLRETDFTLTSRSTAASIGLSLPLFARRVTVSSRSNLTVTRNRSSIGFDSRVSLRPFPFARFDLRLGQGEDALDVSGLFRGEDIEVLIPAAWTVSGFSGTANILENLTLTSGFDEFGLDSSRIDAPGQYSAATMGTAEHRFAAVRFGSRQAAHAAVRYDHWQGSGKMFLRSGGVIFGQVASAGGEAERWLVDVSPPLPAEWFSLEVEHTRVTAEAAGHVEGWPFTDPLQDLLGLRRNFNAEVSVHLWRLTGKGSFHISRGISLSAVTDLFRAYPDLRFSDWMPNFLVFGVADMDRYRDDYERIDFGRIRLHLENRIGRFLLDVRISQLFPINVKKEASSVSEPDGDGGGEINMSSLGTGGRADGGRSIACRINYIF